MIGQTISHYKILEKLGEGGMGVVYKAEDTKLKRTVALKFLPPELMRDPGAKERFLHEAQAAAALEHQHICNIYEIDETGEQIFIVMSCFEGQTLKEKIDTGPLKINEALKIAIQAAEGLQAAHEKEIIHRDIKSANIMVTEKGQTKIMDFGLAKLKGQTKITKEGSTLGTAPYMSPEQAQGADVDHRTDIWSLGVVLYEMITGQLPFKGEYEQAVIYSIINEQPEPLTALRTGVSMELERIVNKTLEKNPSERYQHADDLIVDLRKLKKQTEPEMMAATKRTPIETPKKSPKIYYITGVLMLAVIIVVGGYFFFKGEQETRKPVIETVEFVETKWKNSIAVLPFVDLSPQKDQEYFCDGMTDDIITKLTRIGKLKVISRTSVMRYKNTTKDIKVIGKELNVGTILEGSIRKEKDNIRVTAQLINIKDGFHLWADTFDRKLESVFDVQDEVSKAIAEALQVELSPETLKSQQANRPKNIEAYEYYLKGVYILDSRYIIYKREEDFQAAIKMFKKALEIDPDYINAYSGLVYAYDIHWELTGETKQDLDMLINYSEKIYSLAPNSIYEIFCMGWVNFRKGNYEKAYQYFKRVVEVFPNHSFSKINHGIGYFLSSQGLYRHAIKYFSREVEIDPFYLYAQDWLGNCFEYLGEFKKALIYYKKALEISPNDVYNLGKCAKLLLITKKYSEAEELLARAEKIDHNYSWLPFWKALLPAAKGEKDKALSLYNKEDWNGLQIYSLLVIKQEATRILDKLAKDKLAKNDYYFHYIILINNPFFDNLRDEPRFKEIVEKAKQVYEERVRKYGDL
ncbi:MAG: protein kinase [Candidatus Aminicenantes bacterium]|jgi:non-specific serine/threonine protein kinase